MKKLSSILCLVLLVSCTNEVTSERLVVRNGIVYEVNSTTPFTGTSVHNSEEWSLFLRYDYKDGLQDGLSESFYENGQILLRSYYRKGVEHGLTESFHENGQMDTIENYIEGKRDGLYESYYENGLLSSTGN